MRLNDKTLTCLDCEDSFVFTAAEQVMLLIRGRDDEPNRCPRCFRRAGQRHARRDLAALWER
jgi:hypothetical protein